MVLFFKLSFVHIQIQNRLILFKEMQWIEIEEQIDDYLMCDMTLYTKVPLFLSVTTMWETVTVGWGEVSEAKHLLCKRKQRGSDPLHPINASQGKTASLYPSAQTVDLRARQPATLGQILRFQLQVRPHIYLNMVPSNISHAPMPTPHVFSSRLGRTVRMKRRSQCLEYHPTEEIAKPWRHQGDRKDTDLGQGYCDGGRIGGSLLPCLSIDDAGSNWALLELGCGWEDKNFLGPDESHIKDFGFIN